MTSTGASQVVTKVAPALVAIFILVYFLAFAGDGLFAYFNGDDLMVLYGSWFQPIGQLLKANVLYYSGAFRPLGELFYRPLIGIFGLNPLPFRIVCFGFVLANMGLLYAFCRRLSGSREIAALACLIGAYHAYLMDIYYSSSTIFELLCFFFYYVAFLYYVSIRDRGDYPGVLQSLTLLILYILALDSKEMAVSLPAWIASYELVFHPPPPLSLARLGQWALREGRFLLMSIAVTAPYVAGKLAGSGHMTDNPAFRPDISWNALMNGWKHYLWELFYDHVTFGTAQVIVLWVALLILAVVSRRRELRFAWLAVMTGVLPVMFIAPRALYALYMALPAFYLFAGRVLVLLRDAALGGAATAKLFQIPVRQLATFLLVAVTLAPFHSRQKILVGRPWVESQPLQVLNEYLTAKYPEMPRNARILFLADPLPVEDAALTMLIHLRYRDQGIRVDRVKTMAAAPDAAEQKKYLHVFTLTEREIKEATL